jgi:hypothetical protein
VVDAALEVMDKLIDRMYPFLDQFAPILLGVTEQRLAQSADDLTDSLMIRVLDFWTTLAWWVRNNSTTPFGFMLSWMSLSALFCCRALRNARCWRKAGTRTPLPSAHPSASWCRFYAEH